MYAWKEDNVSYHFNINNYFPDTGKLAIELPPLKNHPLTTDPSRICLGLEHFRQIKYLGNTTEKISILQELISLSYVNIIQLPPVFILHTI